MMKDAQQGTATITEPHWGGHDVYVYQYEVAGKRYAGASYRDWQDPKYSNVQPGGKAPVYFSASHPWVSLLHRPKAVIEALPVVVVMLALEVFAIVAVLRPESAWGLNLGGRGAKAKVI